MVSVDIVAVERFPILSLSLVTEPLRIANRESTKQQFSWRILTPDGEAVTSSSGFVVKPDADLDQRRSDIIILLTSYNVEKALEPTLINWLRLKASHGTTMACVDTGAYIFAKAGLLDKHPAAVHFEAASGYVSEFPKSKFTDKMFYFSPKNASSAGGVATLDLTLALIGHYCSPQLADRTATILNYTPHTINESQGLFPQARLMPKINRDLAKCVEIMMANIETPLNIDEISQLVNVTTWQMNRLFKRYLHTSPAKYYLSLRLEQARNLLINSHDKVSDIALACGFENHETFSRVYKKHYGLNPSKDRAWVI